MIIVYDITYIGLPLLSLGCLVYGVVRKGPCPRWLLLVAAVPPLLLALSALDSSWGTDQPWAFGRQWFAMVFYALFGAGFLALAALVPGTGKARGIACLLALAIPAPVMLLILYDVWTFRVLGW